MPGREALIHDAARAGDSLQGFAAYPGLPAGGWPATWRQGCDPEIASRSGRCRTWTWSVARRWCNGRGAGSASDPTKTGHSRTVSLLHPVADDTTQWRPGATDGAQSVVAGLRGLTVQSLEPEGFVFGRGTKPLSSMELHRRWRRVLAKAQVRYRVPEQLRHSFASTMLSRNAPLLYVQHQGGWRSASVLLRVYARWMPEEAGIRPAPATLLPPAPATASPEGAPGSA